MLRITLFATLAFSAGSAFAAVGAPCVATGAGAFVNTCQDTTHAIVCSDQATAGTFVETVADCTFPDTGGTPQVPGGTCGDISCDDESGQGCADSFKGAKTCNAGAGDICIGISPLLDADPANDTQQFGLLCSRGLSCDLTGAGEKCQAPTGAVCTAFDVSCSGNVLHTCLLEGGEDANFNGTLDTGEDLDGDGTLDEFIIPDPVEIDCATAFTSPGTCDPQATSGPLHGVFSGTTPDTQAHADCNIPQAGEGEGEGEGEGQGGGGRGGDCTVDADCAAGQTCDNGSCVAPPPGCLSNATGVGTPIAGLFAIVALLPLFRRRR